MQKLISILIVSTLAISVTTEANACGDKTFRVGRGIRFVQNLTARHPAAILIHTAAIPASKARELGEFLKEFGYRTQVVDDFAHLSDATKSGQFDIVLIGLDDAANLQQQAESSASKTVIMPVVHKRKKSEQTAAAKKYGTIVKPEYGEDFLIALTKVTTSKEYKAQHKI